MNYKIFSNLYVKDCRVYFYRRWDNFTTEYTGQRHGVTQTVCGELPVTETKWDMYFESRNLGFFEIRPL